MEPEEGGSGKNKQQIELFPFSVSSNVHLVGCKQTWLKQMHACV